MLRNLGLFICYNKFIVTFAFIRPLKYKSLNIYCEYII